MNAPTIHLNGTNGDDLYNAVEEAMTAMRDAVTALHAVRPHGRDYYVQDHADTPGNSFANALYQWQQMAIKLDDVRVELTALADNISGQLADRDHRTKRRGREAMARLAANAKGNSKGGDHDQASHV